MNILFTADSGYIRHIIDCIRSMIRFYSKDGYDIYILHPDIGEQEQEAMADFFCQRGKTPFYLCRS